MLVGVWTGGTVTDAENSMAELALLAETAGSEVLEAVFQRRQSPDPATFIGRGKVEAIREIVQATGADTVICDGELAPSQLRNLEDKIKVKVVDRTALILDIFAQHAKSKEGQAQVELAQLQYMKQRLRGWGGNLSRQAGGRAAGGDGIGGRGPGETKIETDRRRINTKIAKLRRELKEMRGTRDVKRQSRRRNHIPSVAIAGYTNAGKSSLLNRLTDAGRAGGGLAVRDPRPHHAAYDDQRRPHLHDVRHGRLRPPPARTASSRRSARRWRRSPTPTCCCTSSTARTPTPRARSPRCARCSPRSAPTKVPEIIVINKADAADPLVISRLRAREPHSVVVSAKTGEGIDEALRTIESELPRPQVEFDVLLPYERGDLVNRIHQEAEIGSMEHTGDGTLVVGRANADLAGELEAYAR